MDAGNRFVANLLASFPRSTPRAEFFAIQRVRSKMQVPPEGLFDRTNLVSTPYKKIGKGIATISGNRM
jgi:hypothetical protein